MTDDQMQSLRDDIAYMKALAQEGGEAPVLGGTILVASGVIFATASVLHWAAAANLLAIGAWGILWVWLGAMAVFMVTLTILNRRIRGRPGVRSAANRASHAVWSAVGGSIFVIGICMGVISWRLQSPVALALFPSVVLALWGTGWGVQAAMARVGWMRWVAILAWIAAPVVALFAGQAAQFLAYAFALLLCAVVPGLMMMRQEPSDIV